MAIDPEELEPRKPASKPKNLEPMSVEAILEYITDLKSEIARAEAAIAKKGSARAKAESAFKS